MASMSVEVFKDVDVGWNFEKPCLVEEVPAHSRGLGTK